MQRFHVPARRAFAPLSPSSLCLTLCLLLQLVPGAVSGQGRAAFGGGPLPSGSPAHDCISPQQRARVEANIARWHAKHGGLPIHPMDMGTPLYPFYPQAGTLWDDTAMVNYVDLDPTSGILDFEGTDWTYDGHTGHDSALRSFAEQEVGVPIFAVLDGIVVDAHDGEADHNTVWAGQPANYVVLWHGGTHYTYYWHMRKGSVAVAVSDPVKAGTQLGMTGSSGISTGPHLHFESHVNGNVYEPYTGVANPGPSGWVNQIPIRRDTYVWEYYLSNKSPGDYGPPPYDMPRAGTFVKGNAVPISLRIQMLNLPAGSSWELLFTRPDGSAAFDSGSHSFNNGTDYRFSWWWWLYYINLDMTGPWQMQLMIDGVPVVQAPFTVVDTPDQIVNRPPFVSGYAYLDPPVPSPQDVLFCRILASSPEDPDYDLVRYHYQWTINAAPVRDVTSAAHSDALPRGLTHSGDMVLCTVTPDDGILEGTSLYAGASVYGAAVTISGTITLPGCVNLHQPIAFAFRPVGGGIAYATTQYLNSDGTFSLSGVPTGSYQLAIKGKKWLQKNVSVDASGGDVTGVNVTLLPGDINNDNRVNIIDLGLLADAFGSTSSSPKWNANADLNCDGRVDIVDLGLLADGFGKIGDP
jgi:hypothetical protein